jgi:hypothetical protein
VSRHPDRRLAAATGVLLLEEGCAYSDELAALIASADPATTPIRPLPSPDIPNDLWLLATVPPSLRPEDAPAQERPAEPLTSASSRTLAAALVRR